MTRRRLSEHFVIEEFDCNDGTPVPKGYGDALEYFCHTFLEPMRARFGPCRVHSGYRTRAYNARPDVGGARNSYHIYDDRTAGRNTPEADVAADVSFKRGSIREWWDAAVKIRREKRKGNGGIGFYPRGGFIHIDTRDYAANWDGP